MPSIIINDTPISFVNLTPTLTSTLLSSLSSNQLKPTDIYTLLLSLDTKANYIYIEQLLLKTKEINQFISNKDTKLLLALYIEITIANINNYTNQINNIFKTNTEYKSLMGYYFIYKKKDTHNLLKNDSIGMLGKKILNPNEKLSKWINGDESLYEKVKMEYPRAAVFDGGFDCMERTIQNIKTDNVDDSYIEELHQLIETHKCESFTSDINFLIGAIYHKRMDYLNASKFYKKSHNENAVYNYMRITRKIIDENEKYYDITNYIKLIEGRKDFTEPLSDIYKLKMSERWCGNALMKYLLTKDVNAEIRIINLSYFYYKCLEDNELEIIYNFYNEIKDINIQKHEIICLFDINDEKVNFCTNFIVKNLLKLDSDLAKYNLSFFLSKKDAIEILESIEYKNENVLARLSVLKNCLETIKEVVLISNHLSKILFCNFYIRCGNYKMASDMLSEMDNDFSNVMVPYIYYLQYKKSLNADLKKENLNLMDKHLKNDENICVVFLIALNFFEKRRIDECITILKQLVCELEKERNYSKRKTLWECYLLMGYCYFYKGDYDGGMKQVKKSGKKEIIAKIENVIN